MPSGYAIALLPDVPDRQSRDDRPQRVVCRKHSVIAMPAPTRGRGDGSVAWFEQSSFSISARKILLTDRSVVSNRQVHPLDSRHRVG